MCPIARGRGFDYVTIMGVIADPGGLTNFMRWLYTRCFSFQTYLSVLFPSHVEEHKVQRDNQSRLSGLTYLHIIGTSPAHDDLILSRQPRFSHSRYATINRNGNKILAIVKYPPLTKIIPRISYIPQIVHSPSKVPSQDTSILTSLKYTPNCCHHRKHFSRRKHHAPR